jgi:preprotein translocase subunit SecA
MLKRFVKMFGGDPNKREIEKFNPIIESVNALEEKFERLSTDELRQKTGEFRDRLREGEDLDDLMPEAFAAVREASKRTLGMRHYDVQLIGGATLHTGKIAEMRTGEGKTLVATLPLYLNALTGKGVHLVTVNDYLARRDARWMAPIYIMLGLNVGVLQMAARTENGKKAFIVDLEKESPHEDQNQLRMVDRADAYRTDILYGTNSEFGFDYLRDNMTLSLEERVQRGHYYAIVDEVDNVLIDEARTPLIISGPAHEDTEWYLKMAQIVKRLRPEDYEVSEKDRNISLTELGEARVEELLEMPLRDPERPEDVTPEQARLMGYLEQALRAQFLFKRNKDYLVQGGKVVIVDEFTGRLMPGRRWSDGLHQAVEAKEGVKVEAENVTYATITIQNYFRMFEKLAGMTGTAVTEAEEFDKIYKLDVLAIPTNLEYQALRSDSPLVEVEDKDEDGYKYQYYTNEDDTEKKPVFWRRKDYPDQIFLNEEAKFRAIVGEIIRYNSQGRPLLVGTTSVDLSDRLSTRLRADPLRRLAQVLLIRDAWFKKNKREEDGRKVPELEPLYTPLDQLQTPDLRKMAASVEISMNPEDEENLERLLEIFHLEEENKERLGASLKSGIQNEVLNARKHTEESQIIAGAGAFGAVTIATNMAGRGVDIKLGGEMAEEVLAAVNRVLRRAGHEDPYNLQMEERRQALLDLSPEDYGIYDSEVKFFLQQLKDMETVKSLGGLHVIGSERHEARRIDNQLRGRAARQGDPGSSRFYLSLEDDLMRRFGGQQANDLMQRMHVDEAMPIEMGIVSRLVEQSQTRVEGANFDVRKHLLEYDDVLNTQRQKIYAQRDRIFTKDDLSEDVTEMLRTEVLARVPKSLKDDEGPWSLLAWLEQIQPPFTYNGKIVPSYPMRLLVDSLKDEIEEPGSKQAEILALLKIADACLDAEKEHLMNAVSQILDQIQERLEKQMEEREDVIDTFFQGLSLSDETDIRSPRELADELTVLVQLPMRLSPEQQRALREQPLAVRDEILAQVDYIISQQAVSRLIGAVERRLGESIGLSIEDLAEGDWDELADQVYDAVEAVMDTRKKRLVGSLPENIDLEEETGDLKLPASGQIAKDLESLLGKEKSPVRDSEPYYLALQNTTSDLSGTFNREDKDRLASDFRSALARMDGSLSDDLREDLVEDLELALSDAVGLSIEEARQAAREGLEAALEEVEKRSYENRLVKMLMMMPVGTQTSFDRKTHRKIQTRTIRFTYNYFAAGLLENREPEDIAENVLEHLEDAQASMRSAWGRMEWGRLSGLSLGEMSEKYHQRLKAALGEETFLTFNEIPLTQLPVEQKKVMVDELGRQALTEVYRQLLLGVITELWVEYLTEMEALRVAIGLEAYGQRDPLVQYKSRAFGLFQNLVSNMRLGVINRMFTYRPRDLSGLQISARREKDTETLPEKSTVEADAGEEVQAAEQSGAEAEPEPVRQGVQPKKDEGGKKGQAKASGGKKLSKSARRRKARK